MAVAPNRISTPPAPAPFFSFVGLLLLLLLLPLPCMRKCLSYGLVFPFAVPTAVPPLPARTRCAVAAPLIASLALCLPSSRSPVLPPKPAACHLDRSRFNAMRPRQSGCAPALAHSQQQIADIALEA